MKYTNKLWIERMRSRSDISRYLTHLTRGTDEMGQLEVLLKILNEKALIGSRNDGFIRGENSAVCFQDAPLHGIAQNINHEMINREKLGGKERYRPIGLMFTKSFVYKKGGRPVIYDDEEFFKILPKEEQWRFVSFKMNDPNNIIDWTHEREWRIKGDFTFSYKDTHIILPSVNTYRSFIKKVDPEVLENIKGIITLETVFT
jgi:hypothetical protein